MVDYSLPLERAILKTIKSYEALNKRPVVTAVELRMYCENLDALGGFTRMAAPRLQR